MFRALSLLIVFSLPVTAIAQIRLDSEYLPHAKIVAEFAWTPTGDQEIDLLWDVPDGIDFEQVDNRLFIWAAPSTTSYDLRLTTQTKTFQEVTLADGSLRRFLTQATIATHRQRFFVRGTTPEPPPSDPDKPDPPGPDPIPEGYLGFTGKAFELAMNVPATYRKMKVEIIADNFARVAKSAASPREMAAELLRRNRDAIPPPEDGKPETGSPAYRSWRSAFFQPWEAYAGELTKSGEFRHVTEEFQRVFQATADGLERAKEAQ